MNHRNNYLLATSISLIGHIMLGTPCAAQSLPRGGVIRQSSEASCGAAALATLLSRYYGIQATEAEIESLSGTARAGSTTLLGLRDACRAKGLDATGYRMTLAQLLREVEKHGSPILVHLAEPTLHYVLVAGRVTDTDGTAYMLVTDPALGEVTMNERDFLRRWSGYVLVVKSPDTENTRAFLATRIQTTEQRLETLRDAGVLYSRVGGIPSVLGSSPAPRSIDSQPFRRLGLGVTPVFKALPVKTEYLATDSTVQRSEAVNVIAGTTEQGVGNKPQVPNVGTGGGNTRPRTRSALSFNRLSLALEPVFGSTTERFTLIGSSGSSMDESVVSRRMPSRTTRHEGHDHGEEDPSSPTDTPTTEPTATVPVTVRNTFQIMPLGLRYQMSRSETLSADLPYVRRQEELDIGGEVFRTQGEGFGDVQVGYERRAMKLGRTSWNGAFGVGLQVPTGVSVYTAREGQVPLGSGHYEVGTSFGAYRISDPLVVSASVGLYYSLPRSANGRTITPSLGYMVQTGLGYALDDQWVLSQQLSFSRRANVLLVNTTDAQVGTLDQVYLTHGVAFNPSGRGRTLRLNLSLGLNRSSVNYIGGMAFQWAL